MNFGKVIKEEIALKPAKDVKTKKAFLAGLVRGGGTLYEKDGEYGLEFKVPDERFAEIAAEYLKTLCNYEVREVEVDEDRLNKKDVVYVNVYGGNACDVLEYLGITETTTDGISVCYDLFKICEGDENSVKAFMRGLFVSCGLCSIPESAGGAYVLELVFSHSETALTVSETLFSYGVRCKISRRKENFVLYIKSAEGVKDFIAFLPAPVSVLKLTDVMIERELSNNSNRQANCDLGNVNKQVNAAAKQIAAIEKLEKTGRFATMKADLRDTAIARKLNPNDTFSELAEKLRISRSCLNHRLRKIVSLSNDN